MDKALTIRDIIETDGLAYRGASRFVIRNADQLQGIPDEAVGLTAADNVWTGGNEFESIVFTGAGQSSFAHYGGGTFTPTVFGSTSAGAGTYSVQDGRYTRIGRLVFVEMAMTWSAHTGTGNLRFGSLPFTVAATIASPCLVVAQNLTFSNTLVAQFLPGTVTGQFANMSTAAGLGTVAIDTAASVVMSGSYVV